MKNIAAGIFVALPFSILSGCQLPFLQPAIPGSGTSATESRDVAEFDRVKLNGYGQVEIVCGSEEQSLSITTDDNLLELIETKVTDNQLVIKNVQNISPTIRPNFQIKVKNISSIRINGSGSFDVKGVDTESLDIDIAGSGKFKVDGTANVIEVDIAGSGSGDALELAAQEAKTSISGSGSINVNAAEKLKASIAGSGKIRYKGSPTIEKSIAGSGSVKKISE